MESPLSSAPSNVTDYVDLLSQAEARLAKYQPGQTNDQTIIILRSFIKCLPSSGRVNIANDIIGCSDNLEIHQLAQHLLTSLLCPMKAHAKTPIPTPSPRWGAEEDVEEISSEIESVTRNDQAWLKAACLRRDGDKCAITGYYDVMQSFNSGDGRHEERITEITEVAHIIPFALGSFPEKQTHIAATIWDAIYRCFPSLRQRLNFSTAKLNEPYNAITMCAILHACFGSFKLALCPTDDDNVYRIKTYRQFPSLWIRLLPENRVVTFTANDPSIPLPSRFLLEAHAAVAEILHISGMAEYIDDIMRDRDRIGCLAHDGSTDIQRLMLIW
ncbi:hypothetical protein BDZ91DRAFT_742365 [Kalaharituber pfeilii]|nr:hypothetical protein BDZ91DRAFT_742365 [Kalaharituber pfeilii]